MPAPNRKVAEKLAEEKRLRNRKGDPRTIKTPPGGPPKPKPRVKGSNMKSYEPMGAGMRYITARKNDNITHLAQRAGTSKGTVLKLNKNITNPDLIKVGQRIRVPVPKGKSR